MQSKLRRFLFASIIVLSAVLVGCDGKKTSEDQSSSGNSPKKPASKTVIAMLPKLINIDYFDACKRGATKAAEELGVTLIYDGPTEASGSEQNKFIDTWIRQGVNAICIAPNQP